MRVRQEPPLKPSRKGFISGIYFLVARGQSIRSFGVINSAGSRGQPRPSSYCAPQSVLRPSSTYLNNFGYIHGTIARLSGVQSASIYGEGERCVGLKFDYGSGISETIGRNEGECYRQVQLDGDEKICQIWVSYSGSGINRTIKSIEFDTGTTRGLKRKRNSGELFAVTDNMVRYARSVYLHLLL